MPPWLLGLALAVLTFVVYLPALKNGFIACYDDPTYVLDNAHVNRGLTWTGLVWATHGADGGLWLPLTWLSHMLDCQFYGLNPRGHHLTSVLIHAVNTALLFWWLRTLTGATWRSFVVSALFGVHPLRVESVAWVAERKDVLSGFFWFLTLLAYSRFVSESKVQSPKSKVFYVLALLAFAAGLMSKPMVVTLPFVLLLLDWWPFNRWQAGKISGLLVEKAPFLALSALGSVLALVMQRQVNAMVVLGRIPLSERVENAVVSYVRYIGKTLWPENLAVAYPYHEHWGLAVVLPAGAVLALLSLFLVRQRRRRPFLLLGWLWFVGTLAPVIGLVQVGEQAMADRYTYLPQVGLLVCLVWGAFELAQSWKLPAALPAASAALAIIACGWLTRGQVGFWKDGETLFQHAIAVTGENDVAQFILGNAFYQEGRWEEAEGHYTKALEINPRLRGGENNLGLALYRQGKTGEAIVEYQKALQTDPDNADAWENLGNAWLQEKRLDDAIASYQRALKLKPGQTEVQINLGSACFMKGELEDAIGWFQTALAAEPGNEQARYNLAVTCNKLAWTLAVSPDASVRNGGRAVELAEEANQITGGTKPYVLCTLAAAYAEAGRFTNAVAAAQSALQLANTQGNPSLANALQQDIQLYQASRPFRENPPSRTAQ